MSGYEKPNYTQAPNGFFDTVLKEIDSMSELKVTLAVIRHTMGFHRDEHELSLGYLVEYTGLHRETVIDGLKRAMKRGSVTRRKSGNTYAYSMKTADSQVVGKSDQSANSGSRNLPTEVVGKSDQQVVGKSDPRKKGTKEKKESTPVGTEKPVAADEFVSYLAEELDAADVPYAAGWRGRHGKQFKECIGKDVSTETLYKACDRIAERWTDERHHKLTVEHALGDVLNGTPPKHVSAVPASGGNGRLNGTPPEVIEYVFANTRNPVIKSGEERIRSTMATFDFTGGDSPPYPVQKKLGGDDSESWAVLESIRTLCRRALRDGAA